MEIRKLILNTVHKKGEIRVAEIVKKTGFSRTYVHRFFQQLCDEGQIILMGKANKAKYVAADEKVVRRLVAGIREKKCMLQNEGLFEDVVLFDIKRSSGIFLDIPGNVSDIVEYAFSEMLNNAIEHSRSKTIEVAIKKEQKSIHFTVLDRGVGIFENIKNKKGLNSHMDAIQDLLKGKQTTVPEEHSGEGIFFTSKLADMFTIRSARKKLIFNNIIDDVFIKDIPLKKQGTMVSFSVGLSSKKHIEGVFRQYTDDSLTFDKTQVSVKLYKTDTIYISRSQARRIVSGLNKFKTIELDFSDVDTIGQGFADEIFRIWQSRHPDIRITCKDANENIRFMIERVVTKE